MSVTAPYRFVPLSNLIVYPDWAEKVSHDKPFRDGVSGEMTVTLKNKTPLCVGGEQSPATATSAGKVHFFKTPAGRPAIPGSSLKGMLKNVLEIASFSPMRQVEDQKLGVRDLTNANNFYMSRITNAQSGWLRYDEKKGWVIYPCSFYRVHQQNIIDTFGIRFDDWKKCQSVMERYYQLTICPEVQFEYEKEKNGKKIACISKIKKGENSSSIGRLVVTGQPGAGFKENKSAKKYEFVFYNTQENPKTVSSSVMSGFRQIHQDTQEWQFWQSNLQRLKHGIPVFYHANGQSVSSLGLAMMYKLPYKHSIHDAIAHTNAQHTSHQEYIGMADLLFGYIDEQSNTEGLRGRVHIGFAELQDKTPLLKFSPSVVLSSPKPTYYPTYIYQKKGGSGFSQLMENSVKIAGWKRYQAKAVVDYPKLEAKVAENKKVQVQLETIANDTEFSFIIRWHNLRPVELGALLWSLDFDKPNQCYHALGMGKPFGLGQVALSVSKSQLSRNDGQPIENNDMWLAACRMEFQNYMNDMFAANNVDWVQWQECDVIKALQEYATPVSNLDDYVYLSTPKKYAQSKNRDNLEEFVNAFHSYDAIEVNDELQLKTVDYQSDIDTSIDAVKAHIVKQQKVAAREQAKQTAPAEDKALYELEDFIDKAKEEVSKTVKQKAHKELKVVYDSYKDSFDGEQQIKLQSLANEMSSVIGSEKQLDKIVKKISNWT